MVISDTKYEVEEVVVRYQNGHAMAIMYPPHLACLKREPTKPLNLGGRPRKDNDVCYVLNRAISAHFFMGAPKPPVTRYGLAKLTKEWCEQERDRINRSTPDWRLAVSRDAIDHFLKRFFKKQGQRLSSKDLLRMLRQLHYSYQ